MNRSVIALGIGVAMFGIGKAIAADPAKIDWGKVATYNVDLFYPGQSSYEWLRSDEHKGASKETLRGDSCVSCHDEQDAEKDMGNKIVKGGRLEPTPVKGKNGDRKCGYTESHDASNGHCFTINLSGPEFERTSPVV